MRVLALQNKDTEEQTVFTVNDAQYDEEHSGIGFYTPDGYYYYIPNVPISDSNDICYNLAVWGFCDVTQFGEIQESDE